MPSDSPHHSKINSVRHKTARLVAECAETVAARGWCQGYRHKDGRCCIMGAAELVMAGNEPPREVRVLAAEVLHGVIGTAMIIGWNDTKGRTEDDVICALLAASMEVGSDV